MSRERSPDRKRALKIWFESGKQKKPSEIAAELGISAAMVRKWKSIDKWDDLPEPKRGAPKGNKNAKGNKGGKGGPPGNDKAVKHGLFRKFLPDDPETLELFDATETLSPLDMLWMQIRIAWTNLVRSQKIMFVRDQQDETQVLKKQKTIYFGGKDGGSTEEIEWEYQHAWDKQGRVLTSQSAAMSRLSSMIRQYDDMLRAIPPDEIQEEQRLRIAKLKAEVTQLNKDTIPEPVIFKDDVHE